MADNQINADKDVAGMVKTKATKKISKVEAPKMATVNRMTAKAVNPEKARALMAKEAFMISEV